MNKTVAIIGSGFSGLAAACVVAKGGCKVTVFEKNKETGGRARTFSENGYMFDMGPSWYWMPDVFERFFGLFNKNVEELYDLTKLDPGFTMIFGKNDSIDIPYSMTGIYELFEREEDGGAEKLRKFLTEAETKYKIAFKHFIYKPSSSVFEFLNLQSFRFANRLDLFKSFRSHIKKYFKSDRLLKLMEFPILFLGGSADNIPALYSMMNYTALRQGTWYPRGGFSKVTNAMLSIAKEMDVEIITKNQVKKLRIIGNKVTAVISPEGEIKFDAVIASCDYAHSEKLIGEEYRNYSGNYWENKVYSPSCLIFYLGVSKKLNKLKHHNLFFDQDLKKHSDEIYKKPSWPKSPLFYVCCPSKTDLTVAPGGHENLFVLMPVASGLTDTEEMREKYFDLLIDRIEYLTDESFRNEIDFKRSYCINDFSVDYNSYKGNAYGLANTLKQTAFLKPSVRNKKIKNLFYCGQLTVPGPGVPPAIISGEIAAGELLKYFRN